MSHLKWVINYNRLESRQDQGLECKLNLSFKHSSEVFKRESDLKVVRMEFIHFALILDILDILLLQNKFALSLI